MPNRQKSIGKTDETSLSRYEETMAGLQKSGKQVIMLWGASLENTA